MRWDLTGLFWDDYVAPRVPVEKIKRTPPEPVWLLPDYLPNYEEAAAYQFDLATDAEIITSASQKQRLVWDTEFYPNYCLLGAKMLDTGKIIKFEFENGQSMSEADRDKFRWILTHHTMIGFNDTRFDVPLAMAVLAGFDTFTLTDCVVDVIRGGDNFQGMRPYQFYRKRKIGPVPVDNIDLLDLTPLGPSLKKCAGRIAAKRMADLPFVPETVLSDKQKTILRWYWANDLDNTLGLYQKHVKENSIGLRELLTAEYKTDVRSKSDPQIAEAVIRAEIKRITKQRYFKKAEINPGESFRYTPPDYIQFKTPMMQRALHFIRHQNFVIDEWGSPNDPPEMADLKLTIGNSVYQMGIGGLHSTEKKMVHLADDDYELTDNDVTSYYPSLILQQGMYPPNIGPEFLNVFRRIYDRRIAAKRSGDKNTAETLKIVLNGSFGKTGERGGHSVMYYPRMMLQVTLTGQLDLLMLIEALELAGISVVSANTDGIVIKCPRRLISVKQAIIDDWQKTTGLELESVGYKAIYSRDVNNYIAVYETPQKGELTKRIGAYRKVVGGYPLKWNPTCDICATAVSNYLAKGTPIEETIRGCTNMAELVEVREVRGGAVKDGEFLGKIVRWYYAVGEEGEIINAKNGYVVPRSTGGKPCMTMPDEIPADLDWEYYIARATKMLEALQVDVPEEGDTDEETEN